MSNESDPAVLDFSSSKSIPTSLASSKLVREINLTSCKLSGADLPQIVIECKNLTALNLTGNFFTDLPVSIEKLKCLTSLTVGTNQLTAVPRVLSTLSHLHHLSLPYNDISDVSSFSAGFGSLVSLDVSHNSISSIESLAPFKCLSGLRILHLLGNPIFLIENARARILLLLPSLEYLDGTPVADERQFLDQKMKITPMGCTNNTEIYVKVALMTVTGLKQPKPPEGVDCRSSFFIEGMNLGTPVKTTEIDALKQIECVLSFSLPVAQSTRDLLQHGLRFIFTYTETYTLAPTEPDPIPVVTKGKAAADAKRPTSVSGKKPPPPPPIEETAAPVVPPPNKVSKMQFTLILPEYLEGKAAVEKEVPLMEGSFEEGTLRPSGPRLTLKAHMDFQLKGNNAVSSPPP
mmetsp:Transcript_4418/g.6853  ORF Transcript_4418/g.6853 Transcript_4418/m.6853 type:complete len:404 (+) Transcript_4418:71-1282(+)